MLMDNRFEYENTFRCTNICDFTGVVTSLSDYIIEQKELDKYFTFHWPKVELVPLDIFASIHGIYIHIDFPEDENIIADKFRPALETKLNELDLIFREGSDGPQASPRYDILTKKGKKQMGYVYKYIPPNDGFFHKKGIKCTLDYSRFKRSRKYSQKIKPTIETLVQGARLYWSK
jgi:hypothetical protein